MVNIALRNRVPGAVRVDVRDFDGRDVVWVEVDGSNRKGALSSDSSSMLEHAAVTALDAKSGRPIWNYRRPFPQDVPICCGTPNRGVAVLGDVCRKEFGVPERSANVEKRAQG